MRNAWYGMLGGRSPRGLTQGATIVIAALLVLIFWGVFKAIVGAVAGLLAVAIQIAIMILVFLILVYAIKAMSKKV